MSFGILSDVLISPTPGDSPSAITFDTLRNHLWILDNNQRLSVANVDGGFVTLLNLSAIIEGSSGIVYHPASDKIIVSGQSLALFPNNTLIKIDAGSFAIGTEFDLGVEFNARGSSLIWCTDNDRLYLTKNSPDPPGLWKIRVDAGSGFTAIRMNYAGAFPSYAIGVRYNPCTKRIIGFQDGNGIDGNYFDMATNAFISEVDDNNFVFTDYAPSCYDSKRGKVWACQGGLVSGGSLSQFT